MYHNVQFYVTHNGDKIENKFTLFHKDLSTEAKGLILYVADRGIACDTRYTHVS